MNSLKIAIVVTLLFLPPIEAQERRPIMHADYDGWRSIQSATLSSDGTWLAYALVPQADEAEVVVKSVQSGTEHRASIGLWPRWNSAPLIRFSSDGQFVVVATYPSRSESIAGPRPGMAIVETTTGAVTRIKDIGLFQLSEDGPAWVAYSRPGQAPRELVLRNLVNGIERTFQDVVEYSLSRDGKTLVFSVSTKAAGRSGVYVLESSGISEPSPIAIGNGKFGRLTWNADQSQLAFVGNSRLNRWNLSSGISTELTGCVEPTWAPDDGAAIRFSSDGQRIFFGCKPVAVDTPAKSAFEIWHWQDADILPKQKIRAARDRSRAYLAVWNVIDRKVTQLETPDLPESLAGANGRWILGFDDRPYRALQDYEEPFRTIDVYFVNTLTGERKLALKKRRTTFTLSPSGNHALFFEDSAWKMLSIPDGKVNVLTAQLKVRFDDETNDLPDTPPPYGTAGWTRDGKSALLYDRYDVWLAFTDGRPIQNLTRALGRRSGISFRHVPLRGDPLDQSGDRERPLLLRALHEQTKETGFYRKALASNQEPEMLIFGARDYSLIGQSRKSDVLLVTASTFRDFPDLQVTDSGFTSLRKMSDANPQMKQLLWGAAELRTFRPQGGTPLKSILYKPENFDPHKKYPMIVYIYERLSDRLHWFQPPRPEWGHAINVSTYVSNGYLVLAPDIAYTIGQPGDSALKCVLAALDEVTQLGFVDTNAIGIQGHSWGGYEVAYIVSHTIRFRAAEAGALFVNMVAGYGATAYGRPRQFVYERNQSRIGGTLWQYPQRFIRNSPIIAADRIKTPLLLLHNDTDPNTPFAGAVEFYLALRRLKKEVYLFNYNGEGHDLDNWSNGKDFALRMHDYFDHFLKGSPRPEWMIRRVP